MPLVFLSPFKKTYSTNVVSLSFILGLILLVASILLPLFGAFSTEDFWLRLKEYSEQPLIEYYNHYMAYITNFNENYRTYFDSSSTILKDQFNVACSDPLNNCQIEQKGFLSNVLTDLDDDGVKDILTIKYEIDESNLSGTIDIKLMLFLKYGLRKKVKLIMTPMIYIDLPVQLGGEGEEEGRGKEIRLNGDLELIQKSPIASTSVTSKIYYEEYPFKIDYNDNSPFDLLYYYNKYKSNNYTVKYNYEKIEKPRNDNKIQIIMEMHIPKLQKILYTQSVFEAIQYAWMQYIYIFIPIYIILYIIFKFIIQNNIFYSNIKSDL